MARRLGRSVDVLLTQFSYATWVGNPGGRSIFMRNFMVARYNGHGDYVPSFLLNPSFLKQHLCKPIGRPA